MGDIRTENANKPFVTPRNFCDGFHPSQHRYLLNIPLWCWVHALGVARGFKAVPHWVVRAKSLILTMYVFHNATNLQSQFLWRKSPLHSENKKAAYQRPDCDLLLCVYQAKTKLNSQRPTVFKGRFSTQFSHKPGLNLQKRRIIDNS